MLKFEHKKALKDNRLRALSNFCRERDWLRRSPGGGLKTKTMSARFAHFTFCFPRLVRASSVPSAPNKMPRRGRGHRFGLAEREGFEPSVQFPVQQFSRLPQSTALPPLRVCGGANVGNLGEKGKWEAGGGGLRERR